MYRIASASAIKGSPPRVRGEGLSVFCRMLVLGITPACAGRRDEAAEAFTDEWDHPRVCGEKERKTGKHRRVYGSPPRVRGEDRNRRPAP